jgi:hypothetical protein
VVAQFLSDIWVAVFDNASDDSTQLVALGFQQLDSRVSYQCHSENIGALANFEYGLERVTTPFFSVLSDDDYLLPGFYRRALEDLERNPKAMFWAGITLNVDERGVIWDARVGRWPREGNFEPPLGALAVLGGMSPTWTGIVFRREILDRIGLPDREAMGPSDLDFVVKAAATSPFIVAKVPVAVFTLNSLSFSSTEPLSSFWPGWKKMIKNVGSMPGVDERARAALVAKLHADAARMLFRRGANALARGRWEFARGAAQVLQDEYGRVYLALVLRFVARVSERARLIGSFYSLAYFGIEAIIVKSRTTLQAKYGHLITPISRCD